METTSHSIKVCKVSELLDGQSKCVQANGKDIAVFNIKGKLYAIDNICIHAGGTLNDGAIDEEKCQVTCNWHGWGYDLATGKCITHPRQDVFTGTYPVKVQGDEIFVEVK
ncbi:MAG: Rieske (2Fe-2S) protein [Candidatus Melainabacteria bacterium]|nr:Rieske (2Fe-2S) protein [Candidatus Melainabacteria bacterium]